MSSDVVVITGFVSLPRKPGMSRMDGLIEVNAKIVRSGVTEAEVVSSNAPEAGAHRGVPTRSTR